MFKLLRRKLSKIVVSVLAQLFLVSSLVHGASSATCFDTDTKLMLHMNGADASTTFTDSSVSGHTVTVNGNAQIDTAQSKFGSASGLFDGTGDYLSLADSADWFKSTGNFTLDFWVRWNALPASGDAQYLWQNFADGNNRVGMYVINNAGTYAIRYFVLDAGNITVDTAETNHAFATGTWYHIAVTRTGNNFAMFVDGTSIATTTDADSWPDLGGFWYIGLSNPVSGAYTNGWIDEFRLVKGTAVWTGNFSAPTSEYGSSCVSTYRTLTGAGQ